MFGEAMTKFKTLILACLQLIVVVTLWLVVYVESWLTRLMTYLACLPGPLLSPQSLSVLSKIVDSRQKDGDNNDTSDLSQPQTDRESDIQDILKVLDKRNNHHLKGDRIVFENTTAGLGVVADHADLHLYSDRRPTRSDNFKRIENVLRAMSPAALRRTGENARNTMRIYS